MIHKDLAFDTPTQGNCEVVNWPNPTINGRQRLFGHLYSKAKAVLFKTECTAKAT